MDQRASTFVNGKAAIARVSGHFGELVQGRLGPDGPVALVTLPCPCLVTEVWFQPQPSDLAVDGDAPHARRLAMQLLANWAPEGMGGTLRINRAATPGTGAGSSTSDLLGTIRAIAAAFRVAPAPEVEASLCLDIEGAVDPLMHGSVLFASREGRVLRALPPLPAFQVVGGFAGPGQPTDPGDLDFPEMTSVFAALEAAMAKGDLAGVAQAAQHSAKANQDRNPNPVWDEVTSMATKLGALGVVVSHTGSAIGLILPPGQATGPTEAALCSMGLTGVLAFQPTEAR